MIFPSTLHTFLAHFETLQPVAAMQEIVDNYERQQAFERARLLGVFQAYADKPIRTIWERLSDPPV
jgi:hypothetical protein